MDQKYLLDLEMRLLGIGWWKQREKISDNLSFVHNFSYNLISHSGWLAVCVCEGLMSAISIFKLTFFIFLNYNYYWNKVKILKIIW